MCSNNNYSVAVMVTFIMYAVAYEMAAGETDRLPNPPYVYFIDFHIIFFLLFCDCYFIRIDKNWQFFPLCLCQHLSEGI